MNERELDHDIIDAPTTAELTVYEPPKLNEFSAELFSTYLVPNSFNKELDFSAYGLEHIAAELGYSITEQTILSETDTHCFMQAKGQCVRTGRTSVATCRQPKQEKRHGELELDENLLHDLYENLLRMFENKFGRNPGIISDHCQDELYEIINNNVPRP